jgi:protein tyrosine/serine phosphatase
VSLDASTVRRLDWPDCINVRDLGGLATNDGRRTRWAALVRSDVLWRLTETGQQSLRDHGVRTIVDVRFADELAQDDGRYPFRGGKEIAYLNVPFDTRREMERPAVLAAYEAAASRAEIMRLDLDIGRNGIAAAIAAIADAPEGGVVVHCHAGKDRTGIIVGVLLAWLGVADEDIADDYAETAANFESLIEDWLENQARDAEDRLRLREISWPSREAMLGALKYLRRKYRSAEAYLRSSGVTAEQLARLRARMTE